MMNYVEQLWNNWEIRVLVICSLILQIFLLIAAGSRKRVISIRRALLLWTAYLLADYVATFALGYLSLNYATSDCRLSRHNQNLHLPLFWAPFFLLHLGGQDTITAFSIEDNELWKRHLLNLIYQIFLAIYVFVKSWQSTKLLVPVIFMFAAGCLKYAERTWALQRASTSSLRSSMSRKPVLGPSNAEMDAEMVQGANTHADLPYSMAVSKAYMFLQTFKGLFVDLIVSIDKWTECRDIFIELQPKEAYKVIEIELSLMYETLHSKAPIIYTWYGCFLRFFTLICTTLALFFFYVSSKNGYERVDVTVTYMLLCTAVLLELCAIITMLLSFWTFILWQKLPRSEKAANFLFSVIQKIRPEEKSMWSNKMGQFNMINYCLNDKSSFLMETMRLIGVKETWDNYWYTTYTPVDLELKELVFTELKKNIDSIEDAANSRSFYNDGQWVLQREGYDEQLGWSLDAGLDESILLWHIATDLLFHSHGSISIKCKMSRNISNYMMFLLIVHTSMLPAADIGKLQFVDTCAEAKEVLQGKQIDDRQAAMMILGAKTKHDPGRAHLEPSRSNPVLLSGRRLAHELQELFPRSTDREVENMWDLISGVWVEMLCFVAGKCSSSFHARQLSKGGELLTVVWFMMAHLAMGERLEAITSSRIAPKLVIKRNEASPVPSSILVDQSIPSSSQE